MKSISISRFFYSPNVSVSSGGKLVAEPKERKPTENNKEAKATTKKIKNAKAKTDKQTKKQKPYTPGADDDFKALADRTCAAWKINPDITLTWTTQDDMQTLCTTYADELAERKMAGGDRPSITSTLSLLNLDMDTAVTDVKVYIEKKYKKANAKPQFPRYGIVKENNAYILPRDYNKRLQYLDLMIAAIAKDGFGDEEYGSKFWMDVKKRFEIALTDASSTDGTVSGKVSGKNVSRKKLEKIMKALRNVLQGNYPDTYQSVYREWGWQKQNY